MRKKWQGFLRKAYRAVKKLSEVLVDDASTDGTSDAVRQAYTSSQDFFRQWEPILERGNAWGFQRSDER